MPAIGSEWRRRGEEWSCKVISTSAICSFDLEKKTVIYRLGGEVYEEELDYFLEGFEEFPESTKATTNLQESAQSEISEEDNRSCFNKGGENEISEVDKALEELKKRLRIQFGYSLVEIGETSLSERVRLVKEFEGSLDHYMKILVNAMEAEKSNGKKQVETEKKMEEETCKAALDKELASIHEQEKPKSIWKDVSELPNANYEEGFLMLDNAKYVLGCFNIYTKRWYAPSATVDIIPVKVATVTDLINAFEQLQRDVEELKSKVR